MRPPDGRFSFHPGPMQHDAPIRPAPQADITPTGAIHAGRMSGTRQDGVDGRGLDGLQVVGAGIEARGRAAAVERARGIGF